MQLCVCVYVKKEKRERKRHVNLECEWFSNLLNGVKCVAIWREFHISEDIPSVTKNRLQLNYRQLLLLEMHRVE